MKSRPMARNPRPAMTSVAMSLATATLITLFRVERQARADAAQDIALARLAGRWRTDVHAATAVEFENDCQLTLPTGQIVRYAFAAPAISREVRRGEQIEHRDAFVLSRHIQAVFSSEAVTGGQMISLAIRQAETAMPAYSVPIQPVTISAALDVHRQSDNSEARR